MEDVINLYKPISLKQMDRVKLMKRVDTKFIISKNKLSFLLSQLQSYYDVLEINNKRNLPYKTNYYDTEQFQMYILHHNGKKNRYKIRYREYSVSDTSFLEIKFKNNKSKTIKKRIPTTVQKFSGSDIENNFISDYSPYNFHNLELKTSNSFNRITLAHKYNHERITIDNDIKFCSSDNKQMSLNDLCIIEIKQKRFDLNSEFMQLLKANHIRPKRLSKYCIATTLLNPSLKNNRFKEKLSAIQHFTA